MKQVLSFRSESVPGNGATGYTTFGTWVTQAAEFQAASVWNVAGTFRNFRVKLAAAPGAGKSWQFNVRKNGVNTSVTVTISDTATEATDTTNSFTVAAGDYLTIQWVPTATPLSPGNTGMAYSIEFEGTNVRESGYVLAMSTLSNSAATYTNPFMRGPAWNTTTTEGDASCPVAVAGDITGIAVQMDLDPGSAGDAYVFCLYKNGTKQDGAGGTVDTRVTITEPATTGSATFVLAVAAGDVVSIEASPVLTPTANLRASVGTRFKATTDGESMMFGYSGTGVPSNAATNYIEPAGKGTWSLTESGLTTCISNPTTYTLSKLRIKKIAAPGAGKSYTFTVRKNAAASSLSAAVSGTATTGEDLTNSVSIDDGDTAGFQSVPSGTPTTAQTHWSFAQVASTSGVDAGPDQTIQLPPGTATLAGSVSNAGSPSATLWEVISGPSSPVTSGITFDDDTSLTPIVTVTVPGTYVLRLTLFYGASSPQSSVSDTMTLTVAQQLNPCTGGGDVDLGSDPVDGAALAAAVSPLIWAVFHLDSGDLPITAVPGLNDDADYHGGRKESRLLNISRPRFAVSDPFGGLQTSTIDILVADHDYRFRTRMRAEVMINRPFDLWIADDATRRAKGQATRLGHYVITNVEPIGDMTFRVQGADFVGSEVSRFFAERQLVDRRFQRACFPQLPLDLIGKVEPGYYGWVGDDSLDTLSDPPIALDYTAGYGGILDGGIYTDWGWGTVGVTGPASLTLGEAAGGVYESGDTAYVFATAVVGGVESDPIPVSTATGTSFAFSGSSKKLTLSCAAVASATAYRWYVRINAPWGHTSTPRDAEVYRETATNSAELTDAGNENVGPWPPPDTNWTGISATGQQYFIVLARYPAGLTPRQTLAGLVKWGPWSTRPSRLAWIAPSSPYSQPDEYWVISMSALTGGTMLNKWVVDGGTTYLDLTIGTAPHEIINGNITQQGAIPLRYVGDEVINGTDYRAFVASLGVIRISGVHGSDLGTPATRIKLADTVYGTSLLVPGKTGWPFATLYRTAIDEDGDERWYTIVYGLTGDAVVEAAVDGTVPLTANACGFSEDARGVDDLGAASPTISSLALQLLHFLDNFGNPQDGQVWKSGAWKTAHVRNGVPVHRGSSFTAAKTYAESLVSGGFSGGWGFGVDGAAFTLDAWLRAAAINHDGRWAINEHGQLCLLMVDPSASAVASFSDGSVASPTAANIPSHAVPQIVPLTTNLINEIRYVYKKNYPPSVTNPTPAQDALLPRELAAAVDWYSGTIVTPDLLSIVAHKSRKHLDVQFSMHRDGAGPAVIVLRMLARLAWPQDVGELVTFPASLLGCDVRLGEVVTWTHRAGGGSSGAVARRLWLTAKETDANITPGTSASLDVWLEAEDITDL